MAENDIYNNEKKYFSFKKNIDSLCIKPPSSDRRSRYYCRNKKNLKYMLKLCECFEAKDISYVRRLRLLQSFKLICFGTNKDLRDCDRPDIDNIVKMMHSVYKSIKSKSDFIKDMKHMWKILFPEKDEKERIDETIVPYPVRHLSPKIDKSKEKLKMDRLSFDDFERLIAYFSRDPRIQSFITLSQESLGRPQEILYTRIKDIELHDNYAKVFISRHGKEGCGFLICIDSYPYLLKWLNIHPFRKDSDSFLFVNLGFKSTGKQLTPGRVNKMLKKACKDLCIDKPITCYSLKRNGVTFRRLRGESDIEIQHTARWTSTRQLSTYDHSQQEDALKIQLIKKGLLKPEKEYEKLAPKTKKCPYCDAVTGFADELCQRCKRILDRDKIKKMHLDKDTELSTIRKELDDIKKHMEIRKKYDEDIAQLLKIPQVQIYFKNLQTRDAES